jgi:hypothetical protein
MAVPTLTPEQNSPTFILPETGSFSVAANPATYALGIYADPASALYSAAFISGAVDQVRYTYRELGGDVLDIELTEKNIAHSYEKAVLEYGYLLSRYVAENNLGNALGSATGSFDQDGERTDGGENYINSYARWNFSIARRIANRVGTEIGIGGDARIYSSSIPLTPGIQEYDIRSHLSASAASGSIIQERWTQDSDFIVRRVHYVAPRNVWLFFGAFGSLGVASNLSSYGMYSDDSTFEMVPVWEHQLKAAAYEQNINVRYSAHSYDIRGGKLRIYPVPTTASPENIWIEVELVSDTPFSDDVNNSSSGKTTGVAHAGNMPFGNPPFESLNGLAKHWVRRWALCEAKAMLAHIRGKIASGIPIPGETIQLNYQSLETQAREEKILLRDELKDLFDRTLLKRLALNQNELMESTERVLDRIPPGGIYVG